MKISSLTPQKIYKFIKLKWLRNFGAPKNLADFYYYLALKKRINWDNPGDLNQWINWLAFNTDTTLWSVLADKIAVRDYVKKKGLESLLVPLVGIWENPDDLDFDNLQDGLVLKMNNGSGDVRIIHKKSQINKDEILTHFNLLFKSRFGRDTAEPHYLKIEPKLFAEKLLEKDKQSVQSSSLVDYKFWCFNGKPFLCFVITDRTSESITISSYTADSDWICNSETMLAFDCHHLKSTIEIPKPTSLDIMLDAASKLSQGLPQARIDFYEVDGKPYFGEITLTSQAGRMDYFSDEALKQMGQLCTESVKELGLK